MFTLINVLLNIKMIRNLIMNGNCLTQSRISGNLCDSVLCCDNLTCYSVFMSAFQL